IVADELKKTVENYHTQNKHLTNAYAVAIKPQTEEILAISGQYYHHEETENHDVGDVSDRSSSVLFDAHEPGSSIKGATMLAGYQEGVIQPGEVIMDTTIDVKDSPDINSWTYLGAVSDYDALARSSNTYMATIAMRMGGVYNHKNGDSINLRSDTITRMRNYFGQFGLGTQTGIDYPFEALGIANDPDVPGKVLFNAFGQYDTFTTMQLAQYIATIANDGYRVRPHFLTEIHEPTSSDDELGPVTKSINTEVMNRVQMDDKYIERVQEGF